MTVDAPSELVDALVIDVHMAVPPRHGETLRPILERWAVPMPGIAIDLAEFALAGSLSDEVVVDRFPFVPVDVLHEGLAAVRALGSIDADLGAFLDARAETAADRWSGAGDAVERATVGAAEALAAAVQPLAIAYRALPLPDGAPMRLHHLLTGLRYERLGAHVAACDRADLSRSEAVALTASWSDAGGSIAASDRARRDRIEVETEDGCAAMWSAVADLDGWLSALREIDQSRRPASS